MLEYRRHRMRKLVKGMINPVAKQRTVRRNEPRQVIRIRQG